MNRSIASTVLNPDSSLDRKSDDIASGRFVIQTEIDTLLKLKDELNINFVKALNLLLATKGRVIVSGMGKSGHIAGKIAATLASTGTPAFFVHPGEASHGDLGMVVKNDLVLALSNSGETLELKDIVAYTKRFEIPFIIMTSNEDSSLSKSANVALIIPESIEACPHGLAPTTTSTAMLALGDALAIALLERKNFSPEDFHQLHPGGKLGKQLLKVSDLMHDGKEVPIVSSQMEMSDAIIVMTAKHFGCVGVIDKNKYLIGVITDGDLRRHMKNGFLKKKAEQVMTSALKTIAPSALATEGLSLMNKNSITALFVTKNKYPIGILHIHDCLRAGII